MRLRRPTSEAARRYRRAGRPGMRTPWSAANWCAIDLELTGLDPAADQIVAVGMVPITAGRVQLGAARYALISSDRDSSTAALLTHRLRREELDGAPSLDSALEQIIDLLAGRVPVFHHAAVEQAFLAPLLARQGINMPPAADTEQLGLNWLATREGTPPRQSLSLPNLSRALGGRPEPAHHALADAISTAQAFIALATLKGIEQRPATVGAILEASVRTAAGTGRAPIR